MHRHPRIIYTLQCSCRGMGTASAAQLKVNSKSQEVTQASNVTLHFLDEIERPHLVPTAKSWSRPPQSSPSPSNLREPQMYSRLFPTQVVLNKWKHPDQSPPPGTTHLARPERSSSIPSSSSSLQKNATPTQDALNKWKRPEQSPLPGRAQFSQPKRSSSNATRGHPSTSSSHQNSIQLRHQEKSSQHVLPSPRSHRPIANNIDAQFSKASQDLRRNNIQQSNHQKPPVHDKESGTRVRLPQERTAKLALKQPVKSRTTRSTARRKDVYIPTTLTVAMLAISLKVKLEYLLSRMRRVGMSQEATYDYILTSDYAVLLAEELGFNPIVDDESAFDIHPPVAHPNPQSLPSRPPIVTIMGHVDHGKTTLLDTLRSASVAKGEAGGITQHIGAFSVPVSNQNPSSGPQSITFLDTPGHAAFSAMRARGADMTDIVVLVVAADDGIMPQTKEVINLLKRDESQVQLVVAINKIDKPDADAESVKKALMAEGIQLEEFGGDIPAVHVSGLTGDGLPQLVETISAVAEIQDLRAEQEGSVYGRVIESNFHKGLGPVATVLVQRGALKVGSQIISGLTQGKVRRMTDSSGNVVQSALPGMAVTVSGWKTLPKAGDDVLEGSEADIKKALPNRARKAEMETLHEDIEAINLARRYERDARAEALDAPPVFTPSRPKELKLAIKADVSGSGEALEAAVHGIGNSIAMSKVISTAVGDLTESDVMMAKAANATILGFSVSVPRSIQNIAAQNGVPIFSSKIIYRLTEDVRARIIALLPVIVETKVVGEATVLQLFDIQMKSKQTMKVAGCRVINGIVEKQKFARLVRSGNIIHEGSLDTMRQLKREITEARKGMECGLSFKDFSDLQEGDLIQIYDKIEKPGAF